MKHLWILLIPVLLWTACRKDIPVSNDPGAKLSFSDDTLFFDTVFTTLGSSTRRLKIFNPNNDALEISEVRIAGGESSPFRINFNGNTGNAHEDILIESNDSAYLFAEVTIDPNSINTPLIVEDSIVFLTNGNRQVIKLVAWGQDAYFYYPTNALQIGEVTIPYSVVGCNTTWTSDKPHVVYGYLIVEDGCELRMDPGTNVHLHADASIWVIDGGSLKIQGNLGNEVSIQGDRLEPSFEEIPGQWGQIWLSAGSVDNEIDYAIIKNGTVGVRVDTLGHPTNPTLNITNTVIRNMESVGLLGQGSNVVGNNLSIYNCGQHCLVLNIGGTYRFEHCTFGNYWSSPSRQTATVLLNNYYEDINSNIIARDLDEAYFGNCIIWGNNNNEVTWDRNNGANFEWLFDHTIYKVVQSDWPNIDFGDPNRFKDAYINTDPLFEDPLMRGYELDTLSPAQDAGDNLIGSNVPFDLLGNSRLSDVAPDLGAYERQD